ncbi:uncharacterized protein LOC142343986 [Convolutriloba macropyga]|uniref:uncharacterized protein LOC142343986 n=1 Tax=Convolutriloba macropyga TaxID=536237 RepID=UPI003F5219FF
MELNKLLILFIVVLHQPTTVRSSTDVCHLEAASRLRANVDAHKRQKAERENKKKRGRWGAKGKGTEVQSTPGVLEFLLPNNETLIGRLCKSLSLHFCLTRFRYTQNPNGLRYPTVGDKMMFELLIIHRYRSLNWFSLYPQTGGCCKYQVRQYSQYGQVMGVGPAEYFASVSDFSLRNKHLSYIYSSYNETRLSNIIERVGFGPHKLKVSGKYKKDFDFIFPIASSLTPTLRFS